MSKSVDGRAGSAADLAAAVRDLQEDVAELGQRVMAIESELDQMRDSTAPQSNRETVTAIIEACDQVRMSTHGGYPSDYVIENGKVYWADYDDGKDYNAVKLVVTPIKKFIEEYSWVFED